MGVPGFFSWLIKRYPLVKHTIQKQQVPNIDYLYLDMNGIIYKCVKDDSIIFKSQILPKELQEIWLDVFNYINMLVNILKPNKMVVMGLDGVAPRAKMNNQRSRRFKSSRDHKKFMEKFYGFTGQTQSLQNFKNNSISPGTNFMQELGNNLQFFIKKKIQEDDYWKSLSVIFTSSSSPGQGQHKIMEFIRANKDNFLPEDCHCLYGADADLIMLSMTLPLNNLCIIRQQYVVSDDKVKLSSTKKQKVINFQMIFVTILRQYFQIEYGELKARMAIQFRIERIIKDFVFLFFFIGNDFLPRCMAYNIRQSSIEDLISAFKQFLTKTNDYVVGPQKINLQGLSLLTNAIALRQGKFIQERQKQFDRTKEEIQQSTSFDKQFKEMVIQKNMKQKQFILQLKNLYMNDQMSARNYYYGKYFGINPAQQPQQFYKILSYYLFGLQFVYEYYFINLPSWQWFYPYYCAPLVSDLFYYIDFISKNNSELPRLQPGTPSEPFKQLLCILPKESCQLLPQPFRPFLLEQTSILRTPLDFYPDKFEQQPYGSIRQHEHIALIPFLDLNIVNKVYQQAIVKVQANQLQRNKFAPSILYQYDPKAKQIEISSKFKAIPSTSCTISQTPVNLRERLSWGKNTPKILRTLQHQKLFKMPTLKTKKFFATMEGDKRRNYVVVNLNSKQQQVYKVGNQIFYGYPLQKSGKIQAILNQKQFCSIKQFYTDNYDLEKIANFRQGKFLQQQPARAFNTIKAYLAKQNAKVFDWKDITTLIFAKDTQQFVRCLNGDFKRVYYGAERTQYQIIPYPLASKNKVYQNTMDKISFNKLQEQFWMGEDVIIFPQKRSERTGENRAYIQKGKVVGYTDKKVKVQITQKVRCIDEKKLSNIVHTRQIYFQLKFCAFILQIKPEVLLTLLESVNIQVNHPQMPPSIDIGLNFINRHEEKLVPNLVRINLDGIDDRSNTQRLFKFLDISLKGLEFIIQYKKRFSNVFKFIQKRYQKLIQNKDDRGRINWRQPIKVTALFEEQNTQTQQQKALKSLMNVYLWLIKKQETHMPLSSIYSKQISVKNIRKLQEQLTLTNKQQKNRKHKYGDPKIVQVDPNYLFSRRLSTYGKMHLNRAPLPHTIRDQVICMQPEFYGELGVIIGFDYNKFEVMFSRPSFGKSDLNGICNDLWAGKFFERDLYNFDTWPECMKPRYKTNNAAENIGWDGYQQSNQIIPKFKEKALKQFADIEKLAEKKLFSQQFLQFIEKAKKNQKVEKIDQDFQVVDNRKGQYTYKYDKGQATVSKQYVEKITKDKKYIQKKVQPSLKTQIQKQIIENKAEKQTQKQNKTQQKIVTQQPTKPAEQNDDEDDGDDMLK